MHTPTIHRPHRKRGHKRPKVKRIPTEVYSRVVGFLRPVSAWNDGKQQEWKDRKTYDLEQAMERIEDGTVARH